MHATSPETDPVSYIVATVLEADLVSYCIYEPLVSLTVATAPEADSVPQLWGLTQ